MANHTRTFRSKKLNQDHIKILNEAIRHNARGKQKDVHLTYQKENGEVSERKVRPLAVKDKSLFVAHCHERNAIRSFRVERISMVKQAFWDGFDKQAGKMTDLLKQLNMNNPEIRRDLAKKLRFSRKALKENPQYHGFQSLYLNPATKDSRIGSEGFAKGLMEDKYRVTPGVHYGIPFPPKGEAYPYYPTLKDAYIRVQRRGQPTSDLSAFGDTRELLSKKPEIFGVEEKIHYPLEHQLKR